MFSPWYPSHPSPVISLGYLRANEQSSETPSQYWHYYLFFRARFILILTAQKSHSNLSPGGEWREGKEDGRERLTSRSCARIDRVRLWVSKSLCLIPSGISSSFPSNWLISDFTEQRMCHFTSVSNCFVSLSEEARDRGGKAVNSSVCHITLSADRQISAVIITRESHWMFHFMRTLLWAHIPICFTWNSLLRVMNHSTFYCDKYFEELQEWSFWIVEWRSRFFELLTLPCAICDFPEPSMNFHHMSSLFMNTTNRSQLILAFSPIYPSHI